MEKTRNLKYNKFNTKYEYDTSYVPKKFGEKESICGYCNLPSKQCNGDCKRYKEEISKLKKTKKSSVSKNKKTKLVEKSIKNFMKDIRGKV